MPIDNLRYKYFPSGSTVIYILCETWSNLMVYYPILRSSAMAYVNPSIFCRVELLLGIGNGFLTICLFTSLNSDINQMVVFFLGIMNIWEPHSKSGCG